MSPAERDEIADHLYLERGARDAAHRCDVNTRLGDFDLTAALAEGLELAPGLTLADVGCGSGGHLDVLARRVAPGGRALGFDISEEAVESTRGRGLEAHVADAAELPLEDDSVDALSCVFAIYYHPDLPAVVAEFARVLRDGGRLVVAGPAMDTNRELYDFHRRATGAEPSDADTMALGYVDQEVAPALAPSFEAIAAQTHSNRIQFPDARHFLDYWAVTSLFARTPGARREHGEAAITDADAVFPVTKRVTVLTARRRPRG